MRTDASLFDCYHLSIANPERGNDVILDDVSFALDHGTWTEFTGARGCGKSALFAVLCLRAAPPEGQFLVMGRNVDRLGAKRLAEVRRRFGSCAQRPRLVDERNVLENVALPLIVRDPKVTPQEATEVVEALLDRLGIAHLKTIRAGALSFEERSLVGIARALVGQPDVIVVDGIHEQLSDKARDAVLTLLRDRRIEGAAVVVFGREPSPEIRRGGRHFRMADGSLHESAPSTRVPSPDVAPSRRERR